MNSRITTTLVIALSTSLPASAATVRPSLEPCIDRCLNASHRWFITPADQQLPSAVLDASRDPRGKRAHREQSIDVIVTSGSTLTTCLLSRSPTVIMIAPLIHEVVHRTGRGSSKLLR